MIGHQSLFMNWEILQKSSPFCDCEWQKVSFVSIKRKNFSRVCGAARTLVWHNTPFPCQHHLTVTTANWAGGSRANYFLCLMIHPHLKFKDVSDVKKSFFIESTNSNNFLISQRMQNFRDCAHMHQLVTGFQYHFPLALV